MRLERSLALGARPGVPIWPLMGWRSSASTTCGSSSATPGSRRISIAMRSASMWSLTPGSRPRSRHEAGYVLRQGESRFVLVSPLRAEHPDAQRLVQHGDGVLDIALEVDDVPAAIEAAVAAERRRRSAAAHAGRRVRRLRVSPRSTPMATRRTRFVNRDRDIAASSRRASAARPGRYSPRTFHPVGLQGDRPHRRQRRGRQDERLGRLLRARSWASSSSSASTTRTSARSTRR